MASFLTPDDIRQQYFKILKSIKSALNVDDPNSDFVIRGRTYSGIVSGIYGDQSKVLKDTFTTTARLEALLLKGVDYDLPRQSAVSAKSTDISVPGVDGTVVAPGDITFLYPTTGLFYVNTSGGTFASGVLHVAVECGITGAKGNVSAGNNLQVVSPPSGVGSSASVVVAITDGTDIETIDSYRSRLLARQQQPPAGGTAADYKAFAFAASDAVRSAKVKRFPLGLGTVAVYITSGSTDIDGAITNGETIVRIPSPTLIQTVQDYIDLHNPLTDCASVFGPTEVTVDVPVRVALAEGFTLSSVPASPVYNPLGLTVQQLIVREVSRVLYKLSVGGRSISGSSQGYLVASDIEEGLHEWLSAVADSETGLPMGKIPILDDLQVDNLDGSNVNKALGENELAAPGTVTVTVGV